MDDTENGKETLKLPNKVYYSSSEPKLKLHYDNEGEASIIFANGSLTYDLDAHPEDQARVDFIDNLIATRPNISCLVRKLDQQAALMNSIKHRANAGNSGVRAVTGSMHSQHMSQNKVDSGFDQEKIIQELMAEGATREDAEAAFVEMTKASGLTPTVVGEAPAPANQDGITPIPLEAALTGTGAGKPTPAGFGKLLAAQKK